jgi:U3 small nucleolar RNA-associated protein 7
VELSIPGAADAHPILSPPTTPHHRTSKDGGGSGGGKKRIGGGGKGGGPPRPSKKRPRPPGSGPKAAAGGGGGKPRHGRRPPHPPKQQQQQQKQQQQQRQRQDGSDDDEDGNPRAPLEGPDARAPMSDAARQALERARSDAAYLQTLTDKKLRGKLRHVEGVYAGGAVTAARVGEWLLPQDGGALEPEGDLERTWRLQQRDLAASAPEGAAKKAFDLSLPDLGPYACAFSRAGRHVVLGGARGHLAIVEWQKCHLTCELQVREPVRDVCFLHSEQYFAAAQAKRAYIYDKRGVELHRLDAHAEPRALQFLPFHFLLASAGGDSQGSLVYQDVSTGALVAQHKTRLGPSTGVLAQNPHNAVLVAGHTNGCVTMWSPNQTVPLVKMLVHRGPVRAAAVDPTGRYLVTAGADRRVKVWDVRTFTPLHTYLADAAPTSVDVSQRGLLAVAMGAKVQVWPRGCLERKAGAPLLSHRLPTGAARSVRFCPYEDVAAAGAAGGLSTMLVPGAGEPNFDSWVVNPLATLKERRAAEVAQLLDKLQPGTIVLEPDGGGGGGSAGAGGGGGGGVGALRREPAAVAAQRSAEAAEANAARLRESRAKGDARKRMKGKNKPTRRQHRKQTNVVEDRKPAAGQAARREAERKAERARAAAEERGAALEREVPATLHRFYK